MTAESRTAWRHICPDITLPTITLTRRDLGSNPCICDERLPVNRLRHGTSCIINNIQTIIIIIIIIIIIGSTALGGP